MQIKYLFLHIYQYFIKKQLWSHIFFLKMLSIIVNNIVIQKIKFLMNSFVLFCFITFLSIILFLKFMYFFILWVFYVSEMYLDKFQDMHEQAKGREDTIRMSNLWKAVFCTQTYAKCQFSFNFGPTCDYIMLFIYLFIYWFTEWVRKYVPSFWSCLVWSMNI